MDYSLVDIEDCPGVYVLAGHSTRYLYKGASRHLRTRLTEHFNGSVARTRQRRPLRILYYEYCANYSDALRRESYLKSGAGREWLQRHLAKRDFLPASALADSGRSAVVCPPADVGGKIP